MSQFPLLALSCAVLLIGSAFALAQQEADRSVKTEDKDPSLIRRFPVGDDVTAALWSGDGSVMTTLSARKKKNEDDVESPMFKTVKIWNARNGKLLHSFGELQIPRFSRQRLSLDGAILIHYQDSVGRVEELEVWDTAQANMTRRIPIEQGRQFPFSVVLSRDGRSVAMLFWDSRRPIPKDKKSGTIELFDTMTGERLRTLREEKAFPQSAVFTPDGKRLLTRGTDNLVRLWDLQTGKIIRERQASDKSAFELVLSPDGKTLIIPGALQVWDVPSLTSKKDIAVPFRFLSRAAFSPDGKLVVLIGPKHEYDKAKADRYYGIIVRDIEKNQMLREWDPGVEWSAFVDNDSLALLDKGEVKVYRVKR